MRLGVAMPPCRDYTGVRHRGSVRLMSQDRRLVCSGAMRAAVRRRFRTRVWGAVSGIC